MKQYRVIDSNLSLYGADGVFRHRPNLGGGKRPWINLKAANPTDARAECAAYMAAHAKAAGGISSPFVKGEPFSYYATRYLEASCPNSKGEPREGPFCKVEGTRLRKFILPFFAQHQVEARHIRLSHISDYIDWRKKVTAKWQRGAEMEMVTMSNVLSYAVRRGWLEMNYIKTDRPRCRPSTEVAHCNTLAPKSGDELNKLALGLIADYRGEALMWQMLFEAMTGCRTIEILRLRANAKEGEVGYVDGNAMFIGPRAKGGHNPWVEVHPDLAEVIECHRNWLSKANPGSQWMFPGRNPFKAVSGCALTQALRRVTKKLGLPKRISHGFRSFYVTLQRSLGKSEIQIADMIGHRTTGLLASTYGAPPPNWKIGGKTLSWRPSEGLPVWHEWLTDDQKMIRLGAH